MVFCVPDSFLKRGCGTAGLEAVAGVGGSSGSPTSEQWCPGVGLGEAFPVASQEDGRVGEGVWRAHSSLDAALAQNLTAAEPLTNTLCYWRWLFIPWMIPN